LKQNEEAAFSGGFFLDSLVRLGQWRAAMIRREIHRGTLFGAAMIPQDVATRKVHHI
jgi:hypothetical protein